MSDGLISIDDPRADDVRALIDRHLEFARATTPPEHVFALDLDGLVDPAVTFFTYRVNGDVIGMAALKHLDDSHAELKSMHTVEASRRSGVGRAMVEHLLAIARARGFRRVSIETGSMDAYAPARALYAGAGFEPCEPFGAYGPSPNSSFMTLRIDGEG